MSFATIQVPKEYGYVLLACGFGQFATSTVMGGVVMKARSKFNVPYPNLYATPGHHDKADDFNRVQRGHQAYFELTTPLTVMCLTAGLDYPLLSTTAAVLFHIGSYFFQVGYADATLDVKDARYKKGGLLKWVGFLLALGLSTKVSLSIVGLF